MWQMLHALKYLHALNVWHRDIKSSNVMLGRKEGRKMVKARSLLQYQLPMEASILLAWHTYLATRSPSQPRSLTTLSWAICVLTERQVSCAKQDLALLNAVADRTQSATTLHPKRYMPVHLFSLAACGLWLLQICYPGGVPVCRARRSRTKVRRPAFASQQTSHTGKPHNCHAERVLQPLPQILLATSVQLHDTLSIELSRRSFQDLWQHSTEA